MYIGFVPTGIAPSLVSTRHDRERLVLNGRGRQESVKCRISVGFLRGKGDILLSVRSEYPSYWNRLQKPLIFCVFDGVWQSTEDENQKCGSVEFCLYLQNAHKPNGSIRELISAPKLCAEFTVNHDDVRDELHFHPHRVVFLRETSQASPQFVRLSPFGSFIRSLQSFIFSFLRLRN